MKKIISKIKTIAKKLWANRAFRTFIQGFLGVFAGVQLFDINDVDVIKTLIISGIMAGLSAVMSLNTGESKETILEETLEELLDSKGE